MNFKVLLGAVIATALLAGCGGGGGGSSPASSSSSGGGTTSTCSNGATNYPTCTPPTSPAGWEPAVTSVPAATYSGDALSIYSGLNQARSSVGAGLFAQNPDLDTAAANHLKYLLANASGGALLNFHSETSGNADFTGATPLARTTVAGYAGTAVSEDGCAFSSTNAVSGAQCLSSLLDTVYHRLSLLNIYVDVGIAFGTDGNGNTVGVIDIGIPPTLSGTWAGQLSAAPVVYPYAGQAGVATSFVPQVEDPNPAPDLGSATIGYPITVSLVDQALATAYPNGYLPSDIVVNSFTLTAVGGSAPVSARIVTAAGVVAGSGVTLTTDVNAGYISSSLYMLPLSPLAANTTYNVVFTGTVNGQAVNLNWSFTTGAGS